MPSLVEKLVTMKTQHEQDLSFILKSNELLSDENKKILEAKQSIEEQEQNVYKQLKIADERCRNQALQLDRLSDLQVDYKMTWTKLQELRS